MSRAPLIVANWKMYKSPSEAECFVRCLREELPILKKRVWVAPSFVCLPAAVQAAHESMIWIGAQNLHTQEQGAFTGEVSASMIRDAGAKFVILGHSERRQYCKETDEEIHHKLQRALQEQLIPILCIGETLEQRESGQERSILQSQLTKALEGVDRQNANSVVVAYEPVWAIGTGRAATAEQAQEAHSWIRSCLEAIWGREASDRIPLLYGGSVKPENIVHLLEQTDIDGALVGGASLDVRSFIRIVNS